MALRCWLLLLLAGAAAAAGCESNTTQDETAANGPLIRDAAKLPKLSDYLPPLDGGRIEVAAPQDWKVMGRNSKYVTRFFFESERALPRMLLTAEDSPSIRDLTRENLGEFVADVETRLAEEKGVVEPPKQMLIGSIPCVRWVQLGRLEAATVERQILQTVGEGRVYTLELQVYQGQIPKYRDSAYAVMAGVRFLNSGGNEPTPDESDDAQPDADTEPDADANGETAPGADAAADPQGSAARTPGSAATSAALEVRRRNDIHG